MDILELRGLAILLEAFFQRLEAKFNIMPVIKNSIRNYCAVDSEEVNATTSQLCNTSKPGKNLLIGER